jgi:hypothetical protein
MLVNISIDGCDDSTCFNIEVSEEEFKFLQRIAALSGEHSDYQCMPVIVVQEVKKEA